jgi:membrane associated rhomboid family serine protease
MDLPLPAPVDGATQAAIDRRRFRRALIWTGALIALLWWIKAFEVLFDAPLSGFGVRPGMVEGLLGLLTAPLLHGSLGHLIANTLPLVVLMVLGISTVPRAFARTLPLVWLGSGLFIWFTGAPGSVHLGASGLTHGFMFFLLVAGLLRRERQSVATALIVFFLYGGMLMTVFPREIGISWQAHLGGALFGVLGALLWRRSDPLPPRKRYSWEDEDEEPLPYDELEPPRPQDVPVLWRASPSPPERTVVPFAPRRDDARE